MPSHRMVTVEELTQYLHLPEKAVAKELGICLTSLKKLCRMHGITRWPYRKLKSLDRKIAKAENGTGTGGEDPETLKARAEELKKQKASVAFTYGLKGEMRDGTEVKGDDSDETASSSASVTASVPAVALTVSDDAAKLLTKPKKTKPSTLVTKTAASAVLMATASPTPSSLISAKSNSKSPQDWPFSKDSSAIPTPPEEPIHEDDLFGDGDADVEILPEEHMMDDDAISSSLEWDSKDSPAANPPEEAIKSTAQVTLNGASLEGVLEKDKNGSIKMTLVLPSGMSTTTPKPKAAISRKKNDLLVSDADMRIASALASVSSPRSDYPIPGESRAHVSLKEGKISDGSTAKDPPAHPRFDIEEGVAADTSFGHDLMDSEFFSAVERHHHDHDTEEGEDTVHLEDDPADDGSPSSSLDTMPNSRLDTDTDLDKLPAEGLSLDEETRAWLSPDTPEKKGKAVSPGTSSASGKVSL